MFRFRRQSNIYKNCEPEEEPLSVTRLTGATDCVRRVIFLAEHNFVVAASWDNSVRVYSIDTSGEPCAVFQGHTDYVNDVAQLDCDMVASVGHDERLFTWSAGTAKFVGAWEHTASLMSVAKLGESKIIVGDAEGNVMVLTHQSASSFLLHQRLQDSHSDVVRNIVVYGDSFVTCSNDKTSKVWCSKSLTLRATLPFENEVWCAALSDMKIAINCGIAKIPVFGNARYANLLFDLALPETGTGDVAFLNDIIAVLAGKYLYFISLHSKSVMSRVQTEESAYSFTVLRDCRIALGGAEGYCAIITPSKSVQDAVEDYVTSVYPPPLRVAWLAVQNRQLTLAEACRTVITSDNCSTSLDEWCVAHQILMEAVKCGEIHASRDLGDSIAHWHEVLYQHCAKLAMGKKCIDFVKARFREAEDAGVIAKGQVESLINTIGIRHDMESDNRFLVNATFQLFMRQAEMDVRLREVLRYQRVQQVTSLVNAVFGCIPIGGAIAVNLIGGGATILNDVQVCGLAQSVLGIGKDVSGGFGSDYLLDRFLQRANAVISVEEWRKVPVEQRKVVEEAASSLGLSIDELREKLLRVAATQSAGGGETPSAHVLVEDVTDVVKIEPITTIEHVSECVASLSVGVTTAGGAGPSGLGNAATATTDDDESELKRWKEKGVSKDSVGPLKSGDAAACFAAYFLNYESEREGPFSRMKEMLVDVLDKNIIDGRTFVEADEEEMEEILEILVPALTEATDAMKMAKMRAKRFMLLTSQASPTGPAMWSKRSWYFFVQVLLANTFIVLAWMWASYDR